MPLTLTACICSRNRAHVISRALASLQAQQGVDDSRIDILIVDNGSTDNTMEVVEEWRARLPYPVSTAYEERMGIAFARNKSIEAAKGDVIAYIDDDAIAAPDWAAAHLAAYEQDNEVRGVMGRILPEWEAPRPEWLDPLLEPYLTIVDYGDEAFDLAGTYHAPVGANMSFMRNAMLDVGGYDVRFGFGGLGKIPGEENDIARRMQEKGFKLVYWPRACVRHGVSPDRITLAWFKKRVFDQGRCEYIFDSEHHGAGRIATRLAWDVLVKSPALAGAAAIDWATGNKARAARRASVPWAMWGYVRQMIARQPTPAKLEQKLS